MTSDDLRGFSQAFERAVANPEGVPGKAPATELGADALLEQLQSLPEDGKLLPLLREFTAGAAAQGIDAGKLLQDVVARLEKAGTDSARRLAEQVQFTLARLSSETAEPAVALPADGRLAAQVGRAAGLLPNRVVEGAPSHSSPLPEVLGAPSGKSANPARLFGEPLLAQQGAAAGRLLESANQPTPESAQRGVELSLALAALRHPGGAPKAVTVPLNSGTEWLSVPVTASVPQAAGVSGGSVGPTLSLDLPVQQPNWDRALGERIQWLVGQRLQSARIQLNPAHLGPMEVRIQVQQDQANIQFSSAHTVVREALEAALPRLRELFESSGVALLNVDVSGQSLAQQRGADPEPHRLAWGTASSGDQETPEAVLETPIDSVLVAGRLDLFA